MHRNDKVSSKAYSNKCMMRHQGAVDLGTRLITQICFLSSRCLCFLTEYQEFARAFIRCVFVIPSESLQVLHLN